MYLDNSQNYNIKTTGITNISQTYSQNIYCTDRNSKWFHKIKCETRNQSVFELYKITDMANWSKFWGWYNYTVFTAFKRIFYAHQGCVYLINNGAFF